MKSAIDPKAFERTPAPPSRRVVPETKPAAAPLQTPAPAPDNAAQKSDPPKPSSPLSKVATLLLLLCILCASAFFSRATTFSFTNDLPVTMTTMLWTNTSTGYVFYNATNTVPGISNVVTLSFAAQGVAVQATNSDMARLALFSSLPTTGANVSDIVSNTSYISAGVPKNTAQFGTNIAAGAQYTTAVGTNLNSASAFNTNLP